MRIMIFSDVHGNLPAFEAALQHAGDCDAYISLGDLVNYGPWNNECVDLALSLPNAVLLKGNHEEAFEQGSYTGSNPLVQLFFKQTYNSFDRISAIQTFRDHYQIGDIYCVHTFGNLRIYPDTTMSLAQNYCIGHSHYQFAYNNNGFTLFNAGSIGQSRDNIGIFRYLILDRDNNKMQLCQGNYNSQLLLNKMHIERYPSQCIEYYKSKIVNH